MYGIEIHEAWDLGLRLYCQMSGEVPRDVVMQQINVKCPALAGYPLVEERRGAIDSSAVYARRQQQDIDTRSELHFRAMPLVNSQLLGRFPVEQLGEAFVQQHRSVQAVYPFLPQSEEAKEEKRRQKQELLGRSQHPPDNHSENVGARLKKKPHGHGSCSCGTLEKVEAPRSQRKSARH